MLGYGTIGQFTIGQIDGGIPEVVTSDKWFVSLSEPVRSKPGLRPALQQPLAMGNVRPEVSFSWFGNLSDPVRLKIGMPAREQQFFTFYPLPSPFEFTGWFNNLSEPVRLKIGMPAREQQVLAFYSEPLVSFSWFNELSKPRKLDRTALRAEYQVALTFNPQPFVSFGWYGNLTDPVRQKIGLRASLQQAFTSDTEVIPTSKLTNWFANLSEPVRLKIGLRAALQQVTAWPPKLLPTPTVTMTLDANESFDTMAAGVQAWNVAASAEIGVIDTSAFGTEIAVSYGTPSGTITKVSISIRLV